MVPNDNKKIFNTLTPDRRWSLPLPHTLTGELAVSCVRNLRAGEFFYPESWDCLLNFILAIRFAWLSEWLRKKDTQTIEMKRTYMKILLDNALDLKNIWCI